MDHQARVSAWGMRGIEAAGAHRRTVEAARAWQQPGWSLTCPPPGRAGPARPGQQAYRVRFGPVQVKLASPVRHGARRIGGVHVDQGGLLPPNVDLDQAGTCSTCT